MRCCLKTGSDGAEVMPDGRTFHILAQKTGNVNDGKYSDLYALNLK